MALTSTMVEDLLALFSSEVVSAVPALLTKASVLVCAPLESGTAFAKQEDDCPLDLQGPPSPLSFPPSLTGALAFGFGSIGWQV